ncbi:MAG: TolC family protein [Bacteroidaceae bacterium]|nr:TolC family protein [Bacteroidaceae bacterium]
MKKIFIIALTTATLSSCGLYKNYERPADLQIEQIYGDALSGDSLGLGDLSWREIFTDPQLQELIERVLAQNTNMLNADLQIQQCQYALKTAKLAYFPSIYFQPQGSLSKIFDPYDRSQYSTMTSGNSRTYSLPVSLSWQTGCISQLRNAKKQQEVTLEMARNGKQAIQAQLVATTASLYYTLAMLDEQNELMLQTKENWGQYLTIQRKLMDAGQSNIAAVASIEATYYNICDQQFQIEDGIRSVENTLSTLMGEPSQRISRSALDSFKAPATLATGYPIGILARRPDVRAAELNLASAFYQKNFTKGAFFPSFTIGMNGQYTNSLGSAVVNPGMMIGALIASIAQPIFAAGQLKAKYNISKLKMEAASNDFQQTVIAAGNEVNTAMVELKRAEVSRDYIAKQVESLTTALNATKLLMANSSTNYLQVITAHNSLLQSEMSLLNNRMDAINATIDLYQALGGGAE